MKPPRDPRTKRGGLPWKPRRHRYQGERPSPAQAARIAKEASAGFEALKEQLAGLGAEEVAELKSAAPQILALPGHPQPAPAEEPFRLEA